MCSTPRRNIILKQPARQSSKIVGALSSSSALAKADGREEQLQKARELRRQKSSQNKAQSTQAANGNNSNESYNNKNSSPPKNNTPSLFSLFIEKLSCFLSDKKYS